ncbi:TonB-dependent receptor domain-containing protein [Belnapia rosea]|uniref:TonB dependent receptor n=1 Tax=Belnapia rosea TaxID=938405 RepID=A0A1G6ZB23_9PROT|nr:TonB-dependent receptor [Belnapia rosea]SDD99672.1 TonB dependent receptor [Belnapia rosea]
MERETIEGLPGGANGSLNQILLQTPGVVQDSLGDIHIHGEHRNLQYRLNGVQLPEGVAGFAQVFDARSLRSVSVPTGALPAQLGFRTNAVIDLETRTGALDRGGSIGVYGGARGTLQPRITPRLMLNFGVRWDQVAQSVTAGQVSPRVNIVWKPSDTTTFHAGYARTFTPPQFELVQAGSIARYEGTTAAPFSQLEWQGGRAALGHHALWQRAAAGLRRDGEVGLLRHRQSRHPAGIHRAGSRTLDRAGRSHQRLRRDYQLRDGTGIGLGAPQYGMRRGVFAGLSRSFRGGDLSGRRAGARLPAAALKGS